MRNPDETDRFFDALAQLPFLYAAQAESEFEIPANRLTKKYLLLEDVREIVSPHDRPAAEENPSRLRSLEAGNHAQERRFARTVWTEDGSRAAAAYDERAHVEHRPTLTVHAHIIERDVCHGRARC